jgi:hypothetical protein
MNVYVGVDWSATDVDCTVGIEDQPARRIAGAKRTLASVKGLVERIRALAPAGATVHVIIEAGAPGWVELFHHAGAVVHVVDPKQAKAFAESRCSSGAKDDGRDSDNLCAMGRSPVHLPKAWEPRSDLHARLDVLGSLHETLTAECGSIQQRLRSFLREHMPAVEDVFDDLTRKWTLSVLKAVPTAWHAAALTESAFQKLLERSGAHKATRERLWLAFQTSASPWLSEPLARTLAMRVHALVEQLELYGRQIAETEHELDALTSDMSLRKQLESVGGIGTKTANRLIQYAFEQEPEHRDHASIQLGASPVFRGSAKTKKGKPKGHAVMRRSVAPHARAASYLLGRQASRELEWARLMYAAGRSRGQNAATVYRRIARSLLRILTAMYRSGESYDDARYVASLKAKRVSWAQDLVAA